MRLMRNNRLNPALLLRLAFMSVLVAACDRGTEPPEAAAIQAMSPLVQAGTVGVNIDIPPVVKVLDRSGRPAAGVPVEFSVLAGDGSIAAARVVTDSRGEARLAFWRLGSVAGENRLRAGITPEGSEDEGVVFFRADARAGPPARLRVAVEPAAVAATGSLLMPQPVIQVTDQFGNAAAVAGIAVTASAPSPVQAEEQTVTTDANGIAAFSWLRLHGSPGSYTLQFTAPGLVAASATTGTSLVAESPGICGGAVPLAFGLGETRRVTLDRPRGLTCLDFDMDRSAGHQYLVLLENMPMFGDFAGALFDAARLGQPVSPRDFTFQLQSMPRNSAGEVVNVATRSLIVPRVPEQAGHSWDFGEGAIYEIRPEPPPGGVPEPYIVGAGGQALSLNSSAVNPVVGDTIRGIWMERLNHLNILPGPQDAIVRFVSDDLIIAEDVRLPTLLRQGGGYNTPLHPDTLAAMAREYARFARPQSDMLFDGRHNAAVENVRNGRVVAVHSIMFASNIWGYTYSSSDYFVFDYWVGTNGSTGGLNQRVQRVVDNLFMHEVAHMREVGVLQRANATSRRGNQWFVEGFARFTERLPIASRLLDQPDPSRTGNVVLPYNPAFGASFFRDDVPTYLNMITSVFGGYQHSSWIFDYFADQVALSGGDWRLAMREFVAASGRPDVLDGVTTKWTGATLPELFTQARIALMLDDIGTPGLPAWTQYHKFQLRASRPPNSTDPRGIFPRLAPGQAVDVSHSVAAGAGWGYVIDGTAATGNARFYLSSTAGPNAVMSVTRIR
jgi:hypothetical protein